MDSIYDLGDEAPIKKVRHRKKHFLKTIRKQMEFYFSDANLSKNRFLGQLVSKDPQVDLTIFLSFNKIRDMTTDLDDIKKALRKSDMLALTEDGDKVYRKTRVRRNENADESTIYVEELPPDADHEWLKGVFLPYGDVPYVSIPKYPHNGLNKGFAFVEFDSPESATKALEAFGAMGCRLTSEIPPEQICSVKLAMGSEEFKVPAAETGSETRESKQSDGAGPCDRDGETPPVKKRKISSDEEAHEREEKSTRGEEGRTKKTKAKRETAEETESEEKDAADEKEAGKKRKKKAEAEVRDAAEIDEEVCPRSPESESRPPKKRKTKRSREEANEEEKEEGENETVPKKRKKEVAEEEPDDQEEGENETVPKKRKREAATEPDDVVTETDASESKEPKDDEKENDEVRTKKKRSRNHKKKSRKEKTETEPKMNLRVLPKSEWKRLRNKYLDLQKAKMTQLKQQLYRSRWGGGGGATQQAERPQDKTEEKEKKTEKKFEFVPGVIVRLRFDEPPADVKKFKTDAKAHPEVKYVDATEGWNEAYVRCSTAEAANQMVAQQTWSQMDILTGVEETAYWDKMHRDREVQCGRNERVKVRGKAKLLAKVEKAAGKHIRFAAAEDEESGPRG